ncbi:MAG TPA: heterodisulfide reductase-related iron-sulfur binding cluster [Acidobacteriota bacterium]|nr:heterodisulfide reductase-related iron-sulfur binding cluster [Acidobacteriota bacterium]
MLLPPLKRPPDDASEIELVLYEKITQCVRCGVCLHTCPTYRELIEEASSPRGRIALIRALFEGEGEISPELHRFLYGCLECRACETACPNNVVFHNIIEWGKERLSEKELIPRSGRFFRKLFLRRFFRRAKSLDRLMAFLRFYRWSGLRALVRLTRFLKLLPWHLYDLEDLMPRRLGHHRPVRNKKTYTLRPEGEVRGHILFFTGCIADHWLQGANQATVDLLLKAGFEVTVPAAQQCCGALHVHLGETGIGHELARENIDAFVEADPGGGALIVSNAAGCGAVLKTYGEMLKREPEYAERAASFSARVRDISELLASLDGALLPLRRLEKRVTWDDPCHLIHGQQIKDQPRQLIRRIPGVEFVELPECDWCCGSAGVYNLTNYQMSMSLLERKLENLKQTGAEILITSNPGCLLQLRAGIRHAKLEIEVLHIAELLDRHLIV